MSAQQSTDLAFNSSAGGIAWKAKNSRVLECDVWACWVKAWRLQADWVLGPKTQWLGGNNVVSSDQNKIYKLTHYYFYCKNCIYRALPLNYITYISRENHSVIKGWRGVNEGFLFRTDHFSAQLGRGLSLFYMDYQYCIGFWFEANLLWCVRCCDSTLCFCV